MRVRMRTGLSGAEICLNPGDEHDFPDGEAIRLIQAGFALPLAEQPIERAVARPPAETREAAPAEPKAPARLRKRK